MSKTIYANKETLAAITDNIYTVMKTHLYLPTLGGIKVFETDGINTGKAIIVDDDKFPKIIMPEFKCTDFMSNYGQTAGIPRFGHLISSITA